MWLSMSVSKTTVAVFGARMSPRAWRTSSEVLPEPWPPQIASPYLRATWESDHAISGAAIAIFSRGSGSDEERRCHSASSPAGAALHSSPGGTSSSSIFARVRPGGAGR